MEVRGRIQFSTYHGIRRSPTWDGEPTPLAATPPSPPSSRGVPGRGATQNKSVFPTLVTERGRGSTCRLLGLIWHGWAQRRRLGNNEKRYFYKSARRALFTFLPIELLRRRWRGLLSNTCKSSSRHSRRLLAAYDAPNLLQSRCHDGAPFSRFPGRNTHLKRRSQQPAQLPLHVSPPASTYLIL